MTRRPDTRPRRAPAFLPIAVMMLASSLAAQVPDQRTVRRQLEQGQQLLAAESFRAAESLYVATIPLASNWRSLRASAHFGRAFAAHQRLLAGDTLEAATPLDTIVAAYLEAKALRERQLGPTAENNLGLLMRALGRHEDAAQHFERAATAADGSDKVPFLINAGREYETLGMEARAAVMYDRALSADPRSPDALRERLRLMVLGAPADIMLDATARLRDDSATAGIVVDALASLLDRTTMPPNDAEAARAIVQLASRLPIARIGPPSFVVSLRDRLRQAAEARPRLRSGIAGLVDAYAPRDAGSMYREARPPGFWSSSNDSRAAWSSSLRWLGDWHNSQNRTNLARSYYEAAIGGERPHLDAPWVDRGALLPLALIYSESDPVSAGDLQDEVSHFATLLFSGKGEAYKRGDLEQIRDFHTALGALYSTRGEWTGPGAQNAEFQLEHMRRATRALSEKTGRPITDPPELLEKLAARYQATNRPQQAESVKRDVKRQYELRGRPAAGDSAVKRIERDPQSLLQIKPMRPVRTTASVDVPAGAAGAGAAVSKETATPALSVSGVLVDGRTGRKLPRVRFTITSGARTQVITTDDAGEFSVALPAAAQSIVVRIALDGYRTLEQEIRPGGKPERIALMPR